MSEWFLGLSAKRPLPPLRRDAFEAPEDLAKASDRDVVLFVDTFNRYFEPENPRAARTVLEAAGYRVISPRPVDGRRPLCCGRTFLNSGLLEKARTEAQRVVETLRLHVAQGTPVVGLEPSCLLTLRDEFTVLVPHDDAAALARSAFLLEEFLLAEKTKGRCQLALRSIPAEHALVHGHCHQKAFGAMDSLLGVLSWVPNLHVEAIEAGCCGMAGSFGYEAEHYELSMQMAELELFPAVRAANQQTVLVADGTSCRRQILDGTRRHAQHAVRLLEAAALPSST